MSTTTHGRRGGLRTAMVTAAAVLALAACSSQVPGVEEAGSPTGSTTTQPPTTSSTEATTSETSSATSEETTSSAETTSATETSDPATSSTAAGSSDGAAPTSRSEHIADVNLCGDGSYDAENNVCPAGEGDFETTAVHCTAVLTPTEAGDAEFRFYRDGAPLYQVSGTIPEDAVGTMVPVWSNTNVGELLMPGGTYTCEVVLPGGDSETGQAVVSGPTERASQLSICDNTDVYSEGPVTHCHSSVENLPTTTQEIGCSAVLTDVMGSTVDVFAQSDAIGDGSPVKLGTLGPVESGVLVVHGHMSASAVSDDGTFAEGDYTCQFVVDGEQVGEVTVSVTIQ